jgi:uncharacterized membrane protein
MAKQILIIVSNWLHTVATVLLIGHYMLLNLIYLPVSNRHLSGAVTRTVVEEVFARFRPWVYGSLAVFGVTEIYLMLVSPHYLGVGKFVNPWSVLMLVKHILVLMMIGLGSYINVIIRGWTRPSATDADHAVGLSRLQSMVNIMMVCGVVILSLTTAAQAA